MTINAGRKNGIEVGQEYYSAVAGHRHRAEVTPDDAGHHRTRAGSRSAPWTRMSLVTVTHACDTIEIDDHLEPFELPVVPACVTGSSEAGARQLRPGVIG